MNPHSLILFIIKKFYDCGGDRQISNGVRNSVLFVVNMLLAEGHRAKMVEAIDGNSIDALIAKNRPDRVVIEALWVTPAKMAELRKLWPKVKWVIRVHSETPFLAQEGCAVGWIADYLKQGIQVSFNSTKTVDDFTALGPVVHLPNYYPLRKPRVAKVPSDTLDIGCFGAIRPLKNQLIQAFAAVRYAQSRNLKLVFHMNGSRIEQNGSNNLKNIQSLLTATGQTLELHPWMEHEEFLELIASMDICLQVSLSESFNIVSADAVSMGVPLIGSDAISWLPKRSRAKVDSSDSIVSAMERADKTAVIMNHAALTEYLEYAVEVWNGWIKS
jgi:hypothetical protein